MSEGRAYGMWVTSVVRPREPRHITLLRRVVAVANETIRSELPWYGGGVTEDIVAFLVAYDVKRKNRKKVRT